MRIAYLSSFYPYRGGIAQFNAALYREFEKNHEIKAFTFTRQYPDLLFPGKTQYVSESDHADAVPALRKLDSINPISYATTAKEIINYRPDMLLMKFWIPFFGPSLGYISGRTRKAGIKNIAILDNVIPHEKRPGDMSFIKYFLNKTDGYIVMSDAVANDLKSLKPKAVYEYQEHPLYSHFGSKPDKESARKRLGIPDGKKVLLFFGLIRDYKGLDILLEAVAALPDDYYLLVAGEPYSDYGKYEDMITSLCIRDKVKSVPKYIEDNEAPDYFAAADVCVLPYKSATQSGIVGIAYHFDLPVIATDTGGLKEMIVPYGTGIMAPAANAFALNEAILKYFNGADRGRLVQNIAKYKEIASWNKLAEKIEKLYKRLK